MAVKSKLLFDPVAFLAKIGDGRSIKKFGKNQVIFSQGERADSVFFVQKGKVKATVVSEHGKEAVVAIYSANEFFGESCLAGQALRMMTATAMIESTIMRLEKGAMVDTIHREPEFSEVFIAHLLVRNGRVEADLVDQLFNSSERRLARVLLLMANFGKESKLVSAIPRISQEMLADMIGTTRSRVSFFMNKFRKLGLIDYNGKIDSGEIEIHSSLLHVVLNDQPLIAASSRKGAE